jgi:hypothetical protein
MLCVTIDGNPKIPLPIIALTISAVKLHRPMTRTSLVSGLGDMCVGGDASVGVIRSQRLPHVCLTLVNENANNSVAISVSVFFLVLEYPSHDKAYAFIIGCEPIFF